MNPQDPLSISWKAIGICAIPSLIFGVAFFIANEKFPIFVSQYQYLISPVAVLVSAFTAILTGMTYTAHTVRIQTRNAKVKATYDALVKKMWDKDYIAARERYLDLLIKGEKVETLLSFERASDDPSAVDDTRKSVEAIRNIANDYELTALAIKKDVLDEEFVKLWHKSAILKDFRVLRPYIDAVRAQVGHKRIFAEFEEMAVRWEDEDKTTIG